MNDPNRESSRSEGGVRRFMISAVVDIDHKVGKKLKAASRPNKRNSSGLLYRVDTSYQLARTLCGILEQLSMNIQFFDKSREQLEFPIDFYEDVNCFEKRL